MRKKPKEKQYPETFDGVVVGSIFIAISLLWYFLPMLWGRFLPPAKMIFPCVLFVLGVLTVIRHKRAGK